MTGGYLCVVKNPLSVSPAAKYRRLTLPSNLRFATFPFRDGLKAMQRGNYLVKFGAKSQGVRRKEK